MKRKWFAILLIVTLALSNSLSIWAKDLSKNELEDEYIEENDAEKVLITDDKNDNNVAEEEANMVSETNEMEEKEEEANIDVQNNILSVTEASDEEINNSLFAGGTGTIEDPFQISNAEQFNNIRHNLSANYILVSDIDLSIYSNWNAIGTYENRFCGTFDGDNHSITGLTILDTEIDSNSYQGSAEYASLFGYCGKGAVKAVIKNIKMENISITITNKENTIKIGVISLGGYNTISNCSVGGSIDIRDCYNIYVGGIACEGDEIQSCSSNITMQLESNKVNDYHGEIICGGISGMLGNITDSYNYGEINAISGNLLRCGGICGEHVSGKISRCANYGDISGKTIYQELHTNGMYNCELGGIVGSDGDAIEGCVNYGNIEGSAPKEYSCSIGGIAGGGHYMSVCASIDNCFNLGRRMNSSNAYAHRIGTSKQLTECYSLDSTLIDGGIPVEDIGSDQSNGASMNYDSICQAIYEKLGFERPYFTETIIGTLQSINLNNFTVKIDGKDYSVGSEFDMGIATEIINNHESKVIIATLRENEIISMNDITEVVYLKMTLSSDINNLIYSNGKIDTKQFKGKASFSLAVRSPYTMSDLNKVSDVNLISLEDMYLEAYGYGLYFEKGGWFSPNKSSMEIQINETLKLGETKEYSFDIYIEDDYKPESITQSLTMEAGVTVGKETYSDTLHIPVGNIDLQREQQEAKKAKRDSTEEISKAVESLDGLKIAFDNTRLREYFTQTEVNNINKCVTLWISDIVASKSLVHNDDNGVISTLRKKTGLTDDDIMSSVLKKMGVNENVFTKVGNTKATTQIIATGKKGKKYTIYYSLDLKYNAFKETAPYAGSGTGNYYIMIDGRKQKSYGSDMIAYTDINTFANQLQKIAESNIKSAYGEVWGKKADKAAEMIVGETVCKVLKKKTGGTFSDNVFTLFANQTINYTKKISVHCPVDIYVYDADGNVCGAIEDNAVDSSYNSIYMYVDGTEKYFYLTEDDYTVYFLGNDMGEMQYTAEEYLDDTLMRRIEYHNIPLSDGKEYYSSIPDAVYLDNIVYDPVMDTGDVIRPNLDSWQDSLEKRVSTNGITLNQSEMSLNIGEEYKLIANVMPENATNKVFDWMSQDETIASVTDEGVVKAMAVGETLIQAMTIDGGFVSECRIIVTQKAGNPSDKPEDGSNQPSTGNPSDKPENDSKLPSFGNPSDKSEDSSNDPTINISLGDKPSQTDANNQIAKQSTQTISAKTGDSEKLILWLIICMASLGITIFKIYISSRVIKDRIQN